MTLQDKWTAFTKWDDAMTERLFAPVFEALGWALAKLLLAIIYVGIPAFLVALFVKLVVVIYGALPF